MSPSSNMPADSPEQSLRSRYGIDKLTDDNYYSWAWNCKLSLQEQEVWDVVNGTNPDPRFGKNEEAIGKLAEGTVETWEKENQKALRIISFTVIERLQGPVRLGTSAKGAWDELEKVHASKNKQCKFNLLRRLFRLDMAPGSSLMNHEREFDGLVEGLMVMGRVMEPEDLVVIYANSLPAEYGTWLQGQSATLDKISLSDFKGLVHEETQRMINFTNGENSVQSASANIANRHQKKKKDKKKKECYRCGEIGHFAKNCKGKLKDKDDDEDKRDGNSKGEKTKSFGGLAYSFMAVTNPDIPRDSSLWVLDSGATDFMNPDRNLFIDYRAFKVPRHVHGIGSSSITADGIGSVCVFDDETHKHMIKSVLHVPKLKNGLFSITRATLMGWRSVFENGGCKVTHRDFQFHSPIRDNLCCWKSNPQRASSAFTAVSNMLDDWHERLGHVSRNAILNIKDKVEGLVVVKGGHLGEDCEPCALGKHHRRPFQEVDKRREKPLELVHSDLCGQFPVEALGGGWYFVTFMDDCTRFCVVFILKDKESRTLKKAFEMYKAWSENQSGYKLKAIRTDGSGEYEKWMGAFLRDSGIEHQTMAPHTPESNGVLEWMNHTLMEMVDPMMARAKASPKLWGEAVKMACYIRNRLPMSSLDGNITPYEVWTGNVPSIAHIWKFGCLVYQHIPKQTCKKLEHKAKKGILVGYESESGMYHVYHPQNDTIVVSWDLLIFENKINAMVKHPFMDFTGVFDDVDEEASTTTTRPIFHKIKVLPPPKATVPAITATQQ